MASNPFYSKWRAPIAAWFAGPLNAAAAAASSSATTVPLLLRLPLRSDSASACIDWPEGNYIYELNTY